MRQRRMEIKLALLLVVVFTAVVLKPLWQKAWIYMSGAVIPYSSSGLSSTEHHNRLLSVGGERWVSGDRPEEATAYHALVIPPQVELREDGSVSTSDGVSHTETLKWLRPRGLANQADEAKSLTLTYHAITQRVTIGSDTYSLAEGNLFVVRLDDEWRPHVTQLGAILNKAVEVHEVREFFKRALPDDEVVKSFSKRNIASNNGMHPTRDTIVVIFNQRHRRAGEILCSLSSYFRPFRIERLASFQHPIGEMNQLTHRRADDCHLALASLS